MEADGFFGRVALLVDGNRDLTAVLKPVLQARGFDVCVKGSALEALQSMVADHFDVVVCDLQGFGLSRASFEAAVERAQPGLANRCLFVAPHGARWESRDGLLCHRPLDIPELLRSLTFLAAAPVAKDDVVLSR